MPPITNISQLRKLPVYNVGDYGEDKYIPLGSTDLLTLQSITFSTSAFSKTTETVNGSTVFPMDAFPFTISNTDDGGILHEGADTAFDQTYVWTPDMTAYVYKMDINIAFGLSVTAYTAGTYNLGSVIITMTENNPTRPLYTNTFSLGAANRTAAGTDIGILNADVVAPFKVYQGRPITVRIQSSATLGTGTEYIGIIPFFPYQALAIPKMFSYSGIGLHLHAALEHADPVFRGEDNLRQIATV